VTVAYILIKAQLGAANDVAEAVSMIDGVAWTAVITGPYDVIAAVAVGDNTQLGDLVINRIQKVPGVANPTTLVATTQHIGPQGHSWFP